MLRTREGEVVMNVSVMQENLARGLQTVSRAVSSRATLDHEIALRRLEREGAIITTAEMTVFEWVGGAGSPRFKSTQPLPSATSSDVAV